MSADGGWPHQLTISDQRQSEPAWSPDGKWIAYISDYDGDEQWDIFLVSPITGQVINLTGTRDVAEIDPAWSPDGKVLAYASKPRNSSSYEIHLVSLDHGMALELTANTDKQLSNVHPLWSRDGKSVAFTRVRADEKDSDVFVARLADEAGPRKLTAHEGEKTFSAEAWSPDDKSLLVTSNAKNGYENVAAIDVQSGKLDWITSDKWETSAAGYSPDGKTIVVHSNVDGSGEIQFVSRDRKARALPLPSGMNQSLAWPAAFSPDGKRLAYYHDGSDSPRDVWMLDVKTGKSHRVTDSLVGGLRSDDLTPAQLVHFPSRDRKWTLSAFVFIPPNWKPDGRHPGVVYVHGGPEAQFQNEFNATVQLLVSEGYAVIAPNYRGSTGYGKAYQDANRFDMGGADLQDVLAAADFLRATGFVDGKQLAIMGRSYGGYMTMMGLTKAPREFAAGVAIVPFVNWFTEVKNEDPQLREYDLSTMGDPIKDKALWEDRSPLYHVKDIVSPFLMIAGGHDPRCPKEEAQQVFDAVKQRGGDVELRIYENEGHQFGRVENQVGHLKLAIEFLKKHVPPVR